MTKYPDAMNQSSTPPSPPPPAGWYPHPEMVSTLRYWDGVAWTDHIAPMGAASTSADRTPCAYCGEPMKQGGTRCPHCSGEYFWCKHDNAYMPVNTKLKFVGIARGGSKPSHRCRGCGRIIGGAKW